MEEDNIAVGLDIGTTKIVAMIGRKNEYGKVEILGIGRTKSLGVHRGVVNNITQTIQSIQQAVQQAEANSGIEVKGVTVGIAGQHIRSLQHSDYITRNDVEEVIEDEDIDNLCNQVHKLVMLPGEEIIHVLPQEYKVDGQSEIMEPRGMSGGRLEANFHVVVGQISSIRNIGRCVKNSGLELNGMTLEPLASANSVLSQEEKEAGVALIDIGGGTTDLAIFKDGIIRHTAVIPLGGNIITEDIKEGCSIIEKQAKFTCFKNTIHKKIGEQLNQHTFKIQDSINETIYVDVLIDAKGKIILDSMHSTENIKNQLPALESVLATTVDNLPRVFAANKRGVPVATKYRLPILIQLKE